MTDKEKIRAEIERLLNNKEETSHLNQAAFNSGRWKGLMEIKRFVDSLPEEPVSEDLDVAAEEYAKEFTSPFAIYYSKDECRQFEAQHEESFVAGANWQKEQMMKDAIDGKLSFGQPVLLSHPVSSQIAKDGDKVKIVIFKED